LAGSGNIFQSSRSVNGIRMSQSRVRSESQLMPTLKNERLYGIPRSFRQLRTLHCNPSRRRRTRREVKAVSLCKVAHSIQPISLHDSLRKSQPLVILRFTPQDGLMCIGVLPFQSLPSTITQDLRLREQQYTVELIASSVDVYRGSTVSIELTQVSVAPSNSNVKTTS